MTDLGLELDFAGPDESTTFSIDELLEEAVRRVFVALDGDTELAAPLIEIIVDIAKFRYEIELNSRLPRRSRTVPFDTTRKARP